MGLPRAFFRIERHQTHGRSERLRRVGGVEFYTPNASRFRNAKVEVKPSVIIGEEHLAHNRRHFSTALELQIADLFERPERRSGGVECGGIVPEQKPAAMAHDCGTRVAIHPKIERMMLPRRAIVSTDPGHANRGVEIPFTLMPKRCRVGLLTELFAMPEKPAFVGVGFANGHIAGVGSDGVIGGRQRIAKGGRRLCGVQRGQRRDQQGDEEFEGMFHVQVIW